MWGDSKKTKINFARSFCWTAHLPPPADPSKSSCKDGRRPGEIRFSSPTPLLPRGNMKDLLFCHRVFIFGELETSVLIGQNF
jgi:hypothetical protein